MPYGSRQYLRSVYSALITLLLCQKASGDTACSVFS